MKPKPKWGGSRTGSGRKTKGKRHRVAISLSLDPVTLEKLDQESRKKNISRGEVIDGKFGNKSPSL